MVKDSIKMMLRHLPNSKIGDLAFSLAMFIRAHGRIPRVSSGLFNDYLYFLKISSDMYDPLRQFTSDKHYVKSYVKGVLGDGYTPSTLGIFNSIHEIPFSDFSEPCVLKPAHSSGCVVFLNGDGHSPNREDLSRLRNSLLSGPYESAREKNYRYLRKRIICEKMLPEGKEIKDYKVFCYGGQPKVIQVDSDRHGEHKRNIYDARWNPLNIAYNFPVGQWERAPRDLERILSAATCLAREFRSVRVDFYVSGEEIYVGELTHCPESSHGRFDSLRSELLFSEIYFG